MYIDALTVAFERVDLHFLELHDNTKDCGGTLNFRDTTAQIWDKHAGISNKAAVGVV